MLRYACADPKKHLQRNAASALEMTGQRHEKSHSKRKNQPENHRSSRENVEKQPQLPAIYQHAYGYPPIEIRLSASMVTCPYEATKEYDHHRSHPVLHIRQMESGNTAQTPQDGGCSRDSALSEFGEQVLIR